MSKSLGNEAEYRAETGLGIQDKNHCQEWVRECYESLYGKKYEAYHVGSARNAGKKWLNNSNNDNLPAGVIVIESTNPADTQLGDILYCIDGHGGFGHVGIRVIGNRVAENSSRDSWPSHDTTGTLGRLHGYIGFSSIWTFGFQLIVRLPE